MMQHVGQDFSSSIKLNLLPGIEVPRGYYHINLQYVGDLNGSMTYNNMSLNSDGADLTMVFGRDVRDINVFMSTSPVWSGIHASYRYQMRIDRLILLNMACKLLKKS